MSGQSANKRLNQAEAKSLRDERKRAAKRVKVEARKARFIENQILKNDPELLRVFCEESLRKVKLESGGNSEAISARCAHLLESVGTMDNRGPSTSSGAQTQGGRHPKGLKGKAIGLWYRDRAKNNQGLTKKERRAKKLLDKQAKKEKVAVMPLRISGRSQTQISNLLHGLMNQEEFQNGCMDDQGDCESEDLRERYSHINDSFFKRKFLRIISGNIQDSIDKCLQFSHKVERDSRMDRAMYDNLNMMGESNEYKKMLQFRKNLPAFERRFEIVQTINENQVILISGETGCGKTTQVAQFILDDQIDQGNGSITNILCTQPRRISAVSVAERVANERGERLGETVGFHIRLEKKLPRNKGSILYCTTAMLLQFMQSDPALLKYSHIIIDEIHERSTQSDFVVALLKQIVEKRPNLKIILMSATLNSEKFSAYFNDCPIMHIPGFTYPVEEFFLEDILLRLSFEFPEPLGFKNYGGKQLSRKKQNKQSEKYEKLYGGFDEIIRPYAKILRNQVTPNGLRMYPEGTIRSLMNPRSEELNMDFICEVVKFISYSQGPGAILIFLPGLADISKLHRILLDSGSFPPARYRIFPLHSRMPTVDQRLIFEVPPPNVRKIIIATSIAETSITIEDVVYVIECGRTKLSRFDILNNVETLLPEWVTKANAIQRRGRAGRVRPGKCYYLYSRARFESFDEYPLPEMLRARLDELILQIKVLQLGMAADMLSRVMDPPDPRAVEISLDLLRKLNALDQRENLTPLGYHLAQLPLEPRTGKMIIWGAMFGCVDPIFSIAASLSFKDAFYCPLGMEKEANAKKLELGMGHFSDHIALAEALRRFEEEPGPGRFCREYFLSWNTLKLLSDMKRQFANYLHDMKFLNTSNPKDWSSNRNSKNVALVKAIVCAGLYPNVAVVQKATKHAVKVVTPEKETVKVHPSSLNSKIKVLPSPYMVYYMKRKSSDIFLLETTSVNPVALLLASPSSSVVQRNDGTVIEITNGLYFNCEMDTAVLVQSLNEYMDKLLENKINHPGVINWDGWDGKILRAIITLIGESDAQIGLQSFHGWDNWDEGCLKIEEDDDDDDEDDFPVYY